MPTEPAQRPPTIDATAAARWSRLAPAAGSPWLHEEIGRRMEDRLQWIKAAAAQPGPTGRRCAAASRRTRWSRAATATPRPS